MYMGLTLYEKNLFHILKYIHTYMYIQFTLTLCMLLSHTVSVIGAHSLTFAATVDR